MTITGDQQRLLRRRIVYTPFLPQIPTLRELTGSPRDTNRTHRSCHNYKCSGRYVEGCNSSTNGKQRLYIINWRFCRYRQQRCSGMQLRHGLLNDGPVKAAELKAPTCG